MEKNSGYELNRNDGSGGYKSYRLDFHKNPVRHYGKEDVVVKSKFSLLAGTVGKYVGRVLLCIVSFLLVIVMGLLSAIYVISKGPSSIVREMFVVAMIETGAMDFCAHLFLPTPR